MFLAAGFPVHAAAADENDALRATAPAPIQDDANLHDVQFLDGQSGWAVGDHGVIWRTDDGGRSWQLLPCPADCALRSVCFLSDRVGWIAGGATMPFTRLGVGIVIGTTDGGRTWTELARGRLPQLHRVRFFSLNDGVLVGEATAEFPTGVITTHDGGKTWQPVEGGRHPGWRAADFLSREVGVVAGLDGTVARVDGKLVDVRAGGFGPRGLYGVKLAGDDTGWIVGDGAIVLRTANRGVVWQSPPSPLPEEAAEIFNFRAIAVRGAKLWIAVRREASFGARRTAARLGTPSRRARTRPSSGSSFIPTRRVGPSALWAAFFAPTTAATRGAVLRGGNRRAALLSLQPRAGEISFAVLAKEAGERGYRSVVVLPFHGAEEGAATLPQEFDLRLHDAVTSSGGSQGSIGWRFPLDIPGLDRDAEKLIADWMRRTEGRFEEAFYGNLVCQIRTWRPTIIVIDQPAPGDAAGNVLTNAVIEAVRQAADPACFPAHRDLAALAPWKTSRVFARLPPGSGGDFVLQTHERLPRLHSTVATIATSAASRLTPLDADSPETEAFRLVAPSRESGQAEPADVGLADFFTGIAVGPDARRQLLAVDSEVDERSLRLAERDRNFAAILKQRTKTASHGAELLAMLRSSTRGADRTTASLQLATLADAYRRNGQWELAEAALVELVERYPNQAATFEAMRWLLQYWTGAELTYQRFRVGAAQKDRLEFNPAPLGETIQRAVALARIRPQVARSDRQCRCPGHPPARHANGSSANWRKTGLARRRIKRPAAAGLAHGPVDPSKISHALSVAGDPASVGLSPASIGPDRFAGREVGPRAVRLEERSARGRSAPDVGPADPKDGELRGHRGTADARRTSIRRVLATGHRDPIVGGVHAACGRRPARLRPDGARRPISLFCDLCPASPRRAEGRRRWFGPQTRSGSLPL